MSREFQAPRGFHDIFGEDLKKFRHVSDTVRKILKSYNFEEIILPVVEFADLFERSIGEATDIVQKEMFVFEDKKGRRLALRPEGTAGAVRAYIQNRLFAERPYHRIFYEGPMFRHERPQAGRYRQFHQIGAEIFGADQPVADAEIIKISDEIVKALKVKARIEINSLGCKVCRPAYREALVGFLSGVSEKLCDVCKDRKERNPLRVLDCKVETCKEAVKARIEINSLGCRVCRPAYREALVSFLSGVSEKLCDVCKDRKERNPLRVLDCKVETCKEAVKEAPRTTDYLCEECERHYSEVKRLLDSLGVSYVENPHLVRGLDYYTRTVFEVVSEELGSAVIAGGRYDHLVEEFGGPSAPALGFAVGVERLALLVEVPKEEEPVYFLIPFGDVIPYALKVAETLRSKGKIVELSLRKGNLRKQLDFANRRGFKYVVIVGEDEMKEGVITLKDMETGEQVRIRAEEVD